MLRLTLEVRIVAIHKGEEGAIMCVSAQSPSHVAVHAGKEPVQSLSNLIQLEIALLLARLVAPRTIEAMLVDASHCDLALLVANAAQA